MSEKQDTKSRILDAAEKLFGINGFEATSLRDITAEAQVNLAAVNYHFQSKDSLIDAVLARRIEPVNRRRFEMLDAAGPNATLEQILAAFMVPVLDQDLSSVVPLLGRMMSDPTQFVERVFKKYFAPVSQRFQEALLRELPELPRTELLWRTHFMVGTMTHIMSWSQVLPELTEGRCSITDRQAVVDRLVAFAAAGFRAALPQPVDVPAMQGTAVQGTAVQGTAVQGTAVQGTAVQGTAVQGTAVQGTAVQGTAMQGTAVQGTAVQGTAVQRKG